MNQQSLDLLQVSLLVLLNERKFPGSKRETCSKSNRVSETENREPMKLLLSKAFWKQHIYPYWTSDFSFDKSVCINRATKILDWTNLRWNWQNNKLLNPVQCEFGKTQFEMILNRIRSKWNDHGKTIWSQKASSWQLKLDGNLQWKVCLTRFSIKNTSNDQIIWTDKAVYRCLCLFWCWLLENIFN